MSNGYIADQYFWKARDFASNAQYAGYVSCTLTDTHCIVDYVRILVRLKSSVPGYAYLNVTLGDVTVNGQKFASDHSTIRTPLNPQTEWRYYQYNIRKSIALTHDVLTVTVTVDDWGIVVTDVNGKWLTPKITQMGGGIAFSGGRKGQRSVVYFPNGGTGAPDTQIKWYNETLTLSSKKPTRPSYEFWHWNTKNDNTGTTYAPGAKYSKNENGSLTLYAIWNPIVKYDANGGALDKVPAQQTKTYGKAFSPTTAKPTRAGYVFWHWNTKNDNTGTTYGTGAQYTGNAALTLYAIWNPVISYSANGGTGAPAPQTKTYGKALDLQTKTPTRTGYAFKEWRTARDGTGDKYDAGATMPANKNSTVTLYAQWTKTADPPTISSLTVIRSNEDGAADDGGTCCKVTARWAVDTTNVSGNTATVTGKITPATGSGSTTFSLAPGGTTSGTATALVRGCDTDTQYSVTVTVTDKGNRKTTRTAIMTRASFIIDCRKGGKAMGIGSAAPQTGLEVGWPTQFDEAVGMLGGLSVGKDLTVVGKIETTQLKVVTYTSGVFTESSGWTVAEQYARVYGKVVSIRAGLRPTANKAAGTSQAIGTVASDYRPVHIQGFADGNGIGTVNASGTVTYRNVVAITTSTMVYVGLTYLRA